MKAKRTKAPKTTARMPARYVAGCADHVFQSATRNVGLIEATWTMAIRSDASLPIVCAVLRELLIDLRYIEGQSKQVAEYFAARK